MSSSVRPHRTGLVFGSLLGVAHLTWSLLVALNVAQPLINFVFRLHMIQPPYVVMPFSLGLALGLIAMTFVIGYLMGYILALIWNTVSSR